MAAADPRALLDAIQQRAFAPCTTCTANDYTRTRPRASSSMPRWTRPRATSTSRCAGGGDVDGEAVETLLNTLPMMPSAAGGAARRGRPCARTPARSTANCQPGVGHGRGAVALAVTKAEKRLADRSVAVSSRPTASSFRRGSGAARALSAWRSRRGGGAAAERGGGDRRSSWESWTSCQLHQRRRDRRGRGGRCGGGAARRGPPAT